MFLTSTLETGELWDLYSCRFIPGDRSRYPLAGRLVAGRGA